MTTRRTLLLASPLLLAGCGFRPLYRPGNMPSGEALSAELAAVQVARIGERQGQLLRRALMARLEDTRPGTAPRYELRVGVRNDSDVQGYRTDGAITRIRVTVSADFVLMTLGTEQEEILRGTARKFDAFNLPDLQFFAADISREAMERRLMEDVAEDIARRLALEFRRRGEA
ncbi:hypothetical protein EOD42_09540 [Rhodovarius crocodyli]|uniref:LPS-assembly lipoprotein LptE n=1 Tax=Rhodovarius crocodyli TaxID=1979269 RepID=A0A437MGB4_9PROT|nr:LPS assembly lipoprotein LptE [Rhodovarius crocodyli]RVT96652.1 hypothetical protein EOD42_09540 [Rhodovarius crocodyli]